MLSRSKEGSAIGTYVGMKPEGPPPTLTGEVHTRPAGPRSVEQEGKQARRAPEEAEPSGGAAADDPRRDLRLLDHVSGVEHLVSRRVSPGACLVCDMGARGF